VIKMIKIGDDYSRKSRTTEEKTCQQIKINVVCPLFYCLAGILASSAKYQHIEVYGEI